MRMGSRCADSSASEEIQRLHNQRFWLQGGGATQYYRNQGFINAKGSRG